MEVTQDEQKKGKRIFKKEDSLRDLGKTASKQTFKLQGSQKEKRERKDQRKYLKRL